MGIQDSSDVPRGFTFEKAADLFSDAFGAEFAGTLGRAARGLVARGQNEQEAVN